MTRPDPERSGVGRVPRDPLADIDLTREIDPDFALDLDAKRDAEDDDEYEADPGRHNGLSLVLGILGMILIPIGLTVLFLAITKGDRPQQNTLTAQSVVPGKFTPSVASLEGRWNILAGPDSWVGYSVNEEMLSVPTPNVAAGRTTAVDGGIVISATSLEAVAFNVDMTQLKSDDAKRDETLRTRGLETDRFPKASFSISDPVALPKAPPIGEYITLKARGELTLHGVSREIDVEFQAQLIDGNPLTIEVVGHQEINFRDFNVEPPNIANIISVQDRGTIEIHIRLARVPDEVSTLRPKGTGTSVPGSVPPGSVPSGSAGSVLPASIAPTAGATSTTSTTSASRVSPGTSLKE